MCSVVIITIVQYEKNKIFFLRIFKFIGDLHSATILGCREMASTFVLASRSSSIFPSAWPSQDTIPFNAALSILVGSLASAKGFLQFRGADLDEDKDRKKGKLKG